MFKIAQGINNFIILGNIYYLHENWSFKQIRRYTFLHDDI
jgi:hypothetical protein